LGAHPFRYGMRVLSMTIAAMMAVVLIAAAVFLLSVAWL
jgi:hypothetical protein